MNNNFKLYEFIIKPKTFWGSLFRGDTLFGRICIQIIMDKGENELTNLLEDYDNSPFIVTSSAFPLIKKNPNETYYILPTPKVPLKYIFNNISENANTKEYKKKKNLIIKNNNNFFINIRSAEKLSEEEISKTFDIEYILKTFKYIHNTINRFTFTTGKTDTDEKNMFSPYDVDYYLYNEDKKLNLLLFILIDESKIKIEEVKKLLENVGKYGFGKDQSLGYGKFSVEGYKELNINYQNVKSYYALSPFVPPKEDEEKIKIYFSPYIKYGKHGDPASKSEKYLKKIIVMCEEGSIIKMENYQKPYYGIALKGISTTIPQAVAQGYTILMPSDIEI